MILLVALLITQAEIGPRECTHPSPDDGRPYTLCLAETYNDEVERQLQRQLKITLEHVRYGKGARYASRLRAEQRHWDQQRNRACAAEADEAPVPEQARAQLTCLARTAEPRIAHLAAISTGT